MICSLAHHVCAKSSSFEFQENRPRGLRLNNSVGRGIAVNDADVGMLTRRIQYRPRYPVC